MTTRKAVVVNAGQFQQLQSGDKLDMSNIDATTLPYGVLANTITQGNDSRLSDYRQSKMFAHGETTTSCGVDTTEDILASILIPAGTLGNNDRLRIRACGAANNNANAKTVRIRLSTSSAVGGTVYFSLAINACLDWQAFLTISQKNATNTQEGFGGAITNSIYLGKESSSGLITSNLSNASDMYIIVTGQKTTSTDTISINNYEVEILRA